MSYLSVFNLRYQSSNLRNRIVVACVKAAQDVLNEDPGTPNHLVRAAWAQRAMRDAVEVGDEVFWGVLGNSSIQANGEQSTDSDIQFVVNSLVNTFSGIDGAQRQVG